MALSTYINVVIPCKNLHNNDVNALINCILIYDNYYNIILKEPIVDLYRNLKWYENNITEPYDTFDRSFTREKYLFALGISRAFSVALNRTLINIRYDENAFLHQDNFVEPFVNILTIEILSVLIRLSKNPESFLTIVKPNRPIIILPYYPIQKQIYSNKIQPYKQIQNQPIPMQIQPYKQIQTQIQPNKSIQNQQMPIQNQPMPIQNQPMPIQNQPIQNQPIQSQPIQNQPISDQSYFPISNTEMNMAI
jgi:hypothetical protein